MNNLLSYCGSTDSRMRAFDKDLPVNKRLVENFYLSVRYSDCEKKNLIQKTFIHCFLMFVFLSIVFETEMPTFEPKIIGIVFLG